MEIYHAELELQQGFQLGRDAAQMKALRFSHCSGWALFDSISLREIKCHECGLKADTWIVSKHVNDKRNPPVMNLYHRKRFKRRSPEFVLLTRDHIIPKSLGGMDSIQNLRPACSACNHTRGNRLLAEDIAFFHAHPELVSKARIEAGIASLWKASVRVRALGHDTAEADVASMELPFRQLGLI